MTIFDLQRLALLGQSVAFVTLCLVLPLLRLWLKDGALGIVLPGRRARGLDRVVAVATLVLLMAYLVWALLFWRLGPELLDVWLEDRALVAAGIALQLVGMAVVVVSQWQMGTSWRIGIDDEHHGLVRHGIYKRVRHPIYTGVLLVALATVLLTPSPWTVSALAMACVLLMLQARLEEKHLVGQHGKAYRDYAAESGRFFPWIGQWR